MRPHQWWAKSAPPPGWNRVKVSENLGATAVVPVAPVNTSLDKLCARQGNPSIFGSEIPSQYLRAVSNQEQVTMACVRCLSPNHMRVCLKDSGKNVQCPKEGQLLCIKLYDFTRVFLKRGTIMNNYEDKSIPHRVKMNLWLSNKHHRISFSLRHTVAIFEHFQRITP